MLERRIYTEFDLENFKKSNIYNDYLKFIKLCCNKIISKEIINNNIIIENNNINNIIIIKLLKFFQHLKDLLKDFPPIKQNNRFGNKAFRLYMQHIITNELKLFLETILLNETIEYITEFEDYLKNSFGNEIRIDYGTGHENNMLIFIYCLYKCNLINESHLEYIILNVFNTYLNLMREIQILYMLEPAGSHGVWGLDDYQCLLFVFGSAQVLLYLLLLKLFIIYFYIFIFIYIIKYIYIYKYIDDK